MTNTAWQQSSSMRGQKRRYLDGGDTANTPPDLDLQYTPVNIPGGLDTSDIQAPLPASQYGGSNSAIADPSTIPQVGWLQRLKNLATYGSKSAPTFTPDPDHPLDALATLAAERPVPSTPSWLQRIAAAGLGAAAGYTNAAGRIRHPIDISAATDNVLHPGYSQQLAQWQSRIAPADLLAQIAGQKTELAQKAATTAATINHLNAQAEYYQGQGRTSVTITPAMEADTDGELKAGSVVPSQVVVAAMNNAAGRWQSKTIPKKTSAQLYEEAKSIPGVDDETARGYALGGGKLPPEKSVPNANEWQLYLDANGGNAKTALAQYRADKIRIAQESRPPAFPNFPNGMIAPVTTPTPGTPQKFATAIKNNVPVIFDGVQWIRADSPTGIALQQQAGGR